MRTSIINLHGVTPMTAQQASELKGGCGGRRRTTYSSTGCGTYTPPPPSTGGCGTTTPPTPTNTGSADVQAGA